MASHRLNGGFSSSNALKQICRRLWSRVQISNRLVTSSALINRTNERPGIIKHRLAAFVGPNAVPPLFPCLSIPVARIIIEPSLRESLLAASSQ